MKFINLLLIIFFSLVFNVYQLVSQTIKASSFGFDPYDSTEAIIKAFTANVDTIIVDKQESDWIVKPIILSGISNKTIIFEEGVVLKAKQGAFTNRYDQLFKMRNAKNIKIIGYEATFKMEKSEYTSDEWRHGISLRKCRNISIIGLTIRDSGGDGIYIAGIEKGSYSEDIHIEDIKSINNKRQGMSVISVQNLLVKNCLFTSTKGTLPEAGVDIEPNNPEDRIVNVVFENCSFIENNHAGIVLALSKLNSSSKNVSIKFYNCYLSMNHHVENSYVASEIIISANRVNPVKGNVLFEKCFIDGSKWGFLYSRKLSDAYHVTFKDCAAKNICQNNTMAPIYLEVPDYHKTYGALGGYTFNNLLLEYDADLPFLFVRGSKLYTLKNIKDINGKVTVISNSLKGISYVNYNPENNVNVNINYNLIRE